MIVQAAVSRMDETPAREGDIPFYALWDDGSEYEAFWQSGVAFRRYHGPQFGRESGDWHTEPV